MAESVIEAAAGVVAYEYCDDNGEYLMRNHNCVAVFEIQNANRHYAGSFATTSANQYPGKMRETP